MPTGRYPHRPRPVAERFWPKVRRGEGCWEWTGARSAKGYGRLTAGRRGDGYLRTHRLSFELAYGPVPDGLFVLHRCDNPPCVRPDHLFLGTKSDNMRDAVSKGRLNTRSARAARAANREAMREYLRSVAGAK